MSSRSTRSQTTRISHASNSMAGSPTNKKRSMPQLSNKPQKRSKTTKASAEPDEPDEPEAEDRKISHHENGGTSMRSTDKHTIATEKASPSEESAAISHALDAKSRNHITLTESTGDIFSAPPNTLLIHACNCQGTWNAGIASAFKSHYPAAYGIYTAHCKKWGHSLLSSALLIPPQTTGTTPAAENDAQHFIGCLFTSAKKGKGKGSVESILEATGPAMEDLMRKLAEHGQVDGVRMCKINSGLFRVPWERTKAAIEGLELEEGQGKEIEVITLEDK